MLTSTRLCSSRVAYRVGPSMRRLVAMGSLLSILSSATCVWAATFTPIVESFVTPVPGLPGVTFGLFPTPPSYVGRAIDARADSAHHQRPGLRTAFRVDALVAA